MPRSLCAERGPEAISRCRGPGFGTHGYETAVKGKNGLYALWSEVMSHSMVMFCWFLEP